MKEDLNIEWKRSWRDEYLKWNSLDGIFIF
ncbi:hypothetical protein BMS3Bbin14_01936 [bacterium BMS3Bbin14]|nr:hypothetical protein BMS3Bbin14_01936 [bacterium BMS3Bbin14]